MTDNKEGRASQLVGMAMDIVVQRPDDSSIGKQDKLDVVSKITSDEVKQEIDKIMSMLHHKQGTFLTERAMEHVKKAEDITELGEKLIQSRVKKQLQKALEESPNNIDLINQLAAISPPDEALELYFRVKNNSGYSPKNELNIFMCFLEIGDKNELVYTYQRKLLFEKDSDLFSGEDYADIAKEESTRFCKRGHQFVDEGELFLAEMSFGAALRLDKNNWRATFGLGRVKSESGDTDESFKKYKEAKRLYLQKEKEEVGELGDDQAASLHQHLGDVYLEKHIPTNAFVNYVDSVMLTVTNVRDLISRLSRLAEFISGHGGSKAGELVKSITNKIAEISS